MAATDNDALLKAMDQLMKEEDRASVIEYAKQLSTKGGDVVGTMRKMSQQGVDTKKEAAMWKKRALLTAAVAVVVCAVMFGLMVASAEFTKESSVSTPQSQGSGRRLGVGQTGGPAEYKDGWVVQNNEPAVPKEGDFHTAGSTNRRLDTAAIDQAATDKLTHGRGIITVHEGQVRRLDDGRQLSQDRRVEYSETMGGTYSYTHTAAGDGNNRRLAVTEETFCTNMVKGGSFSSHNGGAFQQSGERCEEGRRLEEDGRELVQKSAANLLTCDCNDEALVPCTVSCGGF